MSFGKLFFGENQNALRNDHMRRMRGALLPAFQTQGRANALSGLAVAQGARDQAQAFRGALGVASQASRDARREAKGRADELSAKMASRYGTAGGRSTQALVDARRGIHSSLLREMEGIQGSMRGLLGGMEAQRGTGLLAGQLAMNANRGVGTAQSNALTGALAGTYRPRIANEGAIAWASEMLGALYG